MLWLVVLDGKKGFETPWGEEERGNVDNGERRPRSVPLLANSSKPLANK